MTSFAHACLRRTSVLGFLVVVFGGCRADTSQLEGERPEHRIAMWMPSSEPVFITSGWESEGDSLFFFRVSDGGITDSGGAIVTLGTGNQRIVYLSPQGEVVSHFGRTGDGPGEFRAGLLRLFSLADGQVAVWSAANRRLSLLGDRDVSDVQTIDLPPGKDLIGIVEDGILVTTSNLRAWRESELPAVLQTSPMEGAVVSPGDVQSYEFMTLDGAVVGSHAGGIHLPPPDLPLTQRQPWGDWTTYYSLSSCLPGKHYAVVNDRIIVADGSEGAVFSLSRDGTREALTHHSPRLIVTQEMVDAVRGMVEQFDRANEGRMTEESRRLALDRLGAVGSPLPVMWDDMIADPSGPVWLRRAACFAPDDEDRIWDVIGGDGLPLASMTIPPHLRLVAVRDGKLLAVFTDQLEVERVALYSIRNVEGNLIQ